MNEVQTKKKLLTATFSLIIAIVLLSMGTFAWYTLSQNPEVSGISVSFNSDGKEWPFEVSQDYGTAGENATWGKILYIDLDKTEGILRPISTYDLINWYVPEYSMDGSVNNLSRVSMTDIANKPYVEGEESQDGNYIVYKDIWVRTRDADNSYDLRLNNPAKDPSSKKPIIDEGETNFGTYVLWTPTWDDEENKLKLQDDLMSTIRIGFQVFPEGSEDETQAKVFIYEPNCNLHNGLGSEANLQSEVYYVYGTGADAKQIGQYSLGSNATVTNVPKKNGTSYTMVSQMVENTGANHYVIRQKKSSWNTASFTSVNDIQDINSNYIKEIGDFINASGSVINAPYSGLPSMATIDKGHPRHIRIFFWIEGQDVDCWNQVSGGTMFANFEFRGDIHTS